LDDGTHRYRAVANSDNMSYFDKVANYLKDKDNRGNYDISG
jgi:hypothetical protein